MLDHGVRFIVIGGRAEQLHGGARVTFDTNLCYDPAPDNLVGLAAALRSLNVRLRNAPPDLPFQMDARTLQMGSNFTFVSDAGDLDVLAHVEPLGGFEALAATAEVYEFAGAKLQTIALEDLIRVKEHIRRDKDHASLMQLYGIRRVRAERRERDA